MVAAFTLPAAIFATRYSESYDLLHAGLGAAAVALARRARALDRASLGSAGGTKAARAGRLLGIVGLCVAASATIALAVYGVLVYISS